VVRLSRLFQPRNPLFWLMLVLNALSMVLGWVSRSYPLNLTGAVLVAVFGLGNAALGLWLAWRLVREPSVQRPGTHGDVA